MILQRRQLVWSRVTIGCLMVELHRKVLPKDGKVKLQWVGNNYLCFHCVYSFQNEPFGYKPHEEQYLDNPHDVVLFNYNASIPKTYFPVASTSASQGQVTDKPIIATYELNYKKGRVITLGIYSDDIVNNNKVDNYFEKLLLKQGISNITD
jgi:hypothetical protein